MNKVTITTKKCVQEAVDELRFLECLTYPLICNAHYAYQDKRNLYLVLDICLGGDLRFHLNTLKKKKGDSADSFTPEPELKYFFYSVALALQHLHENQIIYRDMKPDNILIAKGGYIQLTDFGITKYVGNSNGVSNAKSGTHGYMAPEIYARSKDHAHSYQSDTFGFGATLYEMFVGKRPFTQAVLEKSEKTLDDESECERLSGIPGSGAASAGASGQLVDLITKCLVFHPEHRPVVKDLINHPFFEGYTEEGILDKSIAPPFVPDCQKCNFETASNEADDIFADKSSEPVATEEQNKPFENYKFDVDNQKRRTLSEVFSS